MNPLILLMLLFFVLGVLDRMFGGRLGMSVDLERGLSQMGAFAVSIVGFYCIGVSAIQNHIDSIMALSSRMPFDLSLIPAFLLAPDMGGYAMAVKLAANPQIGLMSGLLLSSGIGCLLSFQLPVVLSVVDSKDVPYVMHGMIPGILTVPVGILVGGLCLGISIGELMFQMIPVLILCLVMIVGFLCRPENMEKLLSGFGKCIRALGTFLFALVALGLFYEPIKIADDSLVAEAVIVVVKIVVIVGGAQVLSGLVVRYASGILEQCAKLLGINVTSVIGLLLGLVSGVAMLPFFSRMDTKGKIMNSAFGVMGVYVLGGQMAFVAGVTSGRNVSIYILGKLISGVLAVGLAGCRIFTRIDDGNER